MDWLQQQQAVLWAATGHVCTCPHLCMGRGGCFTASTNRQISKGDPGHPGHGLKGAGLTVSSFHKQEEQIVPGIYWSDFLGGRLSFPY